MPATDDPPASAAPHPTLAQLAMRRIAIGLLLVVGAISIAGFVHTFNTFKALRIEGISRDISLRIERDSALFKLAEDNLALLRTQYQQALASEPPADLEARFAARFERWPDGAVRHKQAGHDSRRSAGAYVARNVALTPEIKYQALVQQELTTTFGLAWRARLANIFIASIPTTFANFKRAWTGWRTFRPNPPRPIWRCPRCGSPVPSSTRSTNPHLIGFNSSQG